MHSDLLDGLCAIMVQEPFKLLIVDSVMANLRTDYVGRGELSERQQRLGQYMKRLKHVRASPLPGKAFQALYRIHKMCFYIPNIFQGAQAAAPRDLSASNSLCFSVSTRFSADTAL
jgi:hypothetical protein